MDARLFILRLINDLCHEATLCDFGVPSWSDGQFFRACTLRLERGDRSAWSEFRERLESDGDLALAVRSMLVDIFVVLEFPDTNDVKLSLPENVTSFTVKDEEQFLRLLDGSGPAKALFAHPAAYYSPHEALFYEMEDTRKFIPPAKKSVGEIMYIEMKPGLSGPARIGRVQLSRTRKTIYYDGRKLQSLKGQGYKANFYDVETAMRYWVSKCRKDGNDTLYPGTIEIDEDVREEYWMAIRRQPKNRHLTKFRTTGKYSKRQPR